MKRTARTALAFTAVASVLSACNLMSSLGLTSTGWNLSEKATRQESHALAIPAHGTLWLDVASGDIRVEATADGAPSLEATVTACGSTPEEAAESLAQTQVAIEEQDDGVRISVFDDLFERQYDDLTIRIRSRVDFVLRLPPGTGLDLETESGDIDVRGPFGPCVLDSRYGKLRVDGVDGDLAATTKSGEVRVTNVRGKKLTVDSGYGALEVSHVEAVEIELATESGDVELEHAIGDEITVESGYGDVVLAEISGDVDVRTMSGEVRGRELTGRAIRMNSGYGNVHVETGKGAFTLATTSGSIAVSRVTGGMDARSGYGVVGVDGVFETLSVASSSGNVTVRARPGSAVTKKWTVRSGYGDVDLALPPELACRVEARTGSGEVKIALPLDGGAAARSEREASGTVHGGGNEIEVETDSGDVRVHVADE